MSRPVPPVAGSVLVTGSSGFLGSEVVRQAAAAGVQVRAMVRDACAEASAIELFRANLNDPEGLSGAVRGVEAVIHAAGLAHVLDGRTAPFGEVNAAGTRNLAIAAARAGVRHFVLVSSVSVYGRSSRRGPCREDASCLPVGPYGRSKLEAEQLAYEIADSSGMRLTILRLATAYGEGDRGNIARLMRAIDRGHFVWVGDASNRKSLIHREDAARACLAALTLEQDGAEVYNVSASPFSVREIVTELADALGRSVPGWRIPAPLARFPLSVASALAGRRGVIERARETLDTWLREDVYDTRKFVMACRFQTRVSLQEGIHRQVAWYRKKEGS